MISMVIQLIKRKKIIIIDNDKGNDLKSIEIERGD